MSKKSLFTKIMIVVVTALILFTITAVTALLFGSVNTDIFDFSSLNIANMVPIIILGLFISCAVIGILVLFLAKDIFVKIKGIFFKKDNGGIDK